MIKGVFWDCPICALEYSLKMVDSVYSWQIFGRTIYPRILKKAKKRNFSVPLLNVLLTAVAGINNKWLGELGVGVQAPRPWGKRGRLVAEWPWICWGPIEAVTCPGRHVSWGEGLALSMALLVGGPIAVGNEKWAGKRKTKEEVQLVAKGHQL